MTEESLAKPIPFGRHKGKIVEELPSDYLKFLLETPWLEKKYSDFVEPIRTELAYRDRLDKHFYDETYNEEGKG